MINKVIKSEKEAVKVARMLAKDLREVLAIYESYNVKVEQTSSENQVMVTSPEGYCNILTGSCLENMMEVYRMYELQYQRTNYHIDVVKSGEKYIPAFIICIRYEEENQ